MRNFTIIALALYVSGCASTPQIPSPPREVYINVQVSCVKEMPKKPEYHTSAELKAMQDYPATGYLAFEHDVLTEYVKVLEDGIKACK